VKDTKNFMVKNIFAIFRRYDQPKGTLKAQAQENVLAFLRESYNLSLNYNLDYSIISTGHRARLDGQEFDAILTHVPPTATPLSLYPDKTENLRRLYTPSLMILQRLAEKLARSGTTLQIVAYTAATSAVEPLFREEGIARIIFKGDVDTWQREAREIKQALDELVK